MDSQILNNTQSLGLTLLYCLCIICHVDKFINLPPYQQNISNRNLIGNEKVLLGKTVSSVEQDR